MDYTGMDAERMFGYVREQMSTDDILAIKMAAQALAESANVAYWSTDQTCKHFHITKCEEMYLKLREIMERNQ